MEVRPAPCRLPGNTPCPELCRRSPLEGLETSEARQDGYRAERSRGPLPAAVRPVHGEPGGQRQLAGRPFIAQKAAKPGNIVVDGPRRAPLDPGRELGPEPPAKANAAAIFRVQRAP